MRVQYAWKILCIFVVFLILKNVSEPVASRTRMLRESECGGAVRGMLPRMAARSRAEATIEEYKEALKLAAAGEVEKMRDELECMREELEEAKRDRELAINFAGGAADDVAKAAGEAAAAEREDVVGGHALLAQPEPGGRRGRASATRPELSTRSA